MKPTGETEWEPCPPGVLHEAALDKIATRRQIMRFLGAGVGLAAVGGGAVWGLIAADRRDRNMPRGISCVEVHQSLIAYANNKLSDMELKSRITAHLFECPSCSKSLDRICCSANSGCRQRPNKPTLKPCASEYPPVPRP